MPSTKQYWLILSSALVIVGLQVGLFHAMRRFQTRKPDFAALYQAGRKLDHERFSWLVDRYPSLNSVEYTVQFDGRDFQSDTLHPPYEMPLYAGLAFFKFRIAYPFWWACNLVFFFLSLFLLWPKIPLLQERFQYLLILIATFFPVLLTMVQGQNSLLLLACLTLCYYCLEGGHDFRAGFALAMGMFKFVLVLPIALSLVLRRRWRSLAGFLSGCLLLLLVSLWLVGMTGVANYVRLLAGFGRKAPELPGTESIMPNLRGFLYAVGSVTSAGAWITATTLFMSIVLLLWIDSKLSRYEDLDLSFAMQVLLASLISYHCYPHDAAVLVLPFLLLLNFALHEAHGRVLKISVLVCVSSAYLLPFVGGLSVGMPAIAAVCLVLLALARRVALTRTTPFAIHEDA